MKILILCTGNSCRSQMAHGFLQSFDPSLTVCSAGTRAAGHVSRKAIQVMKEVAVDISHHTSDPVEMYLGQDWDFVVTVCGGANEECPVFPGKVGRRLHMGYDDPSLTQGDDAYVLSEFRRVRDQIHDGFLEFYQQSIQGHQ